MLERSSGGVGRVIYDYYREIVPGGWSRRTIRATTFPPGNQFQTLTI
jgi:hypothetical protein